MIKVRPIIIDDGEFPERSVVRSSPTHRNSMAYQLGHRFSLTLECGHRAVTKCEVAPTVAKCKRCHDEATKS